MDDAYDVPDSTDWLNTPLKDFADLENALHCQICKEFYDTPMITSCNHTFCSKCIRTSLSADGKCPACRASDQANKLRNNWAVQEVVSTFLAARPSALGVARKAQEDAQQPKRFGKRKRTTVPNPDDVAEANESGRTTRSKSRRTAASHGSQPETIEIDDSDADEEFKPDPEPRPSDGLVECPLGCGKRMKEEQVFPHLDKCEDEQKQASRANSRTPMNGFGSSRPSSSQSTRPQDRINELNYSMMKQQALTKKLKEQGIPNWGSQQLMVNRHKEWVNIWNANCDSNRPRTKRELLHDLDVWERTQGGKAPHVNGLNSTIMRKDFDGNAYGKKHMDDFSRLIADAKRKKPPPRSASPKDVDADENDVEKPNINGEDKTSPFFTGAPASQGDPTPYESNPGALSAVGEKLKLVNNGEHLGPAMNEGFRISRPELASNDSQINPTFPTPINTHDFAGPLQPDQEPPSMFNENIFPPEKRALPTATSISDPVTLDTSTANSSRQGSRDKHATHSSTGEQCDLPAHLQMGDAKKMPLFAMQEQPVMDVDGGGEASSGSL